jgi:hypothetical protein
MKVVGLIDGLHDMASAKDAQHGVGAETIGNAAELGGMAATALAHASSATVDVESSREDRQWRSR